MGGGGGFPVKNMRVKGKGVRRVGGGVGTCKGTGKSMRTRLSKLPFSKLPCSLSQKSAQPKLVTGLLLYRLSIR